MGNSTKTKAHDEADSTREIEDIMSEIDSLQKELAEAPRKSEAGPSKARSLKAVPDVQSEEGAGEADLSDDELTEQMAEELSAQVDHSLDDLESDSQELEKEFAALTAAVGEEESDELAEFRGSGDEPSMEETLGGMRDEETTGGLLDEVMNAPAESEDFETGEESMSEPQNEGCLSMTLTGNMNLKLRYEFEGQEVSVGFKDHYLIVTLSDGTEFKIPVKKAQKHLKAA